MQRVIQKTLNNNDLVVGTVFKLLRVIDGDKLTSFFDHGDWTIEYSPNKWILAPNNSLIYCFKHQNYALFWGEGSGDRQEDYELWEGFGEVLTPRPPLVLGGYSRKYGALWHNQLNNRDFTHGSNETIGAWRIRLTRKICEIEVNEDVELW